MHPIRFIPLVFLLAAAPSLAVQSCPANILRATPTTDFADNGDGTVTHNKTGLTWQRCLLGQTWDGAACTGSAGLHGWSPALRAAAADNFAGKTDWRLPNIKELQSIVETGCALPAINLDIFPSQGNDWVWSSTTYPANTAEALLVGFDAGSVGNATKGFTLPIRLVRGGQALTPFDQLADYTPDTPAFASQSNVTASTTITSAAVTLAGLTSPTGIKVSNGNYAINGGGYTSAPGAANNGDQITVRLTSSAGLSTLTTATLTVGSVSGAFDVTTLDDTTPDAFDIANMTNQATASVVTTNAIMVAGLSASVTASSTVGTIVKNGTDTALASTSVANGDTVAIRLTTSTNLNTTINGTLSIGTVVTDNFSVTTVAAVNGACGAANGVASTFAPATGLCATGSASAVSDASPWAWSCVGANSGTTSLCSAPTATTPTSTGSARAAISGGTWAVNTASTNGVPNTAGFIPTTGHAKSPPTLPVGYTFPHGLFDFTLSEGVPGSTATIVLTYPSALPAGTAYLKYGPSPAGYDCAGEACAAPHWYRMPAAQAVIAGNTVTLTIVDGGVGDDDLADNGTIVDQGGPGVPGVPGVAAIPTLSEQAMIALSGLLMLGAFVTLRRQRR